MKPTCIVCSESNRVKYFAKRIHTYHPNRKELLLPTPREADYFRCCNCGLIFQYPLPTEEQIREVYEWDDYYSFSIGDLAARYHKELQGYPNNYYGRRLAFMENYLAPNQAKTLLDVGSGHSIMVRMAQDLGWDAVGIEPSEKWVEAASRDIGANVICGEIDAAPPVNILRLPCLMLSNTF